MKFVLEINCDNAAFGETVVEAENEVGRMLMQIAEKVRNGEMTNNIGRTQYRTLFDCNGNNVGAASFVYEASEQRRE